MVPNNYCYCQGSNRVPGTSPIKTQQQIWDFYCVISGDIGVTFVKFIFIFFSKRMFFFLNCNLISFNKVEKNLIQYY